MWLAAVLLIYEYIDTLWWKCDQEIAYLMYNDQPPMGSKSMYHGHTKGELTPEIHLFIVS